MRFSEVVRHADQTSHSPVWARSKRRRGRGAAPLAGRLVGLLITLLSLFGALTAVMAVKERSIAAGGAVIDGWIVTGVQKTRELVGRAPPPSVGVGDRVANTVG